MAAADNQKLLLTIDANVELLRRSLKQGERDIDSFDRKASQSASGVEGAFGKMQSGGVAALGKLSTAIAAIGVIGLANIGRQVLQLGDDLATAAEQANVSVERYQKLRGGLRALELDTVKVDGVLKRLSDTLGSVQGGSAAEGVVKALDKMGINSRILNGEISTTDGLLDAIAASAKNFKTEAEFTAAVVDVLGRKIGVDFAAAVRDGGVALAEAEGQVTAATESQIAALAAANEAIDKFTEDTQNKFIIWAGSILQNIDQVNRNLQILGQNPGRTAGEASAENVLGGAGYGRYEDEGRRNLPKGGRGGGRAGASAMERAASNISLSPNLTFGGPAKSAPARSARPARAAGRSAVRDLFNLADARSEQFAGVAAGLTAEGGDGNSLSRIAVDLDEIASASERAGKALSDNLGKGREFASEISSNLAQAIVYGQSIGDALVNSFKAAAAEALANGLFDLLLGKDGGGGLLSSIVQGAGTFFGGARALGGPVNAGGAFKVGERGEEVFIPSVSGRIINGNQMAGASGAAPVFDLRGAVTTADLLAQIQALAAQGAIAAIGVGRSDMAAARRMRLPRGMGA